MAITSKTYVGRRRIVQDSQKGVATTWVGRGGIYKEQAAAASGRIMSSLAYYGGLAGSGGIAGKGGGLAG